MKKLVLFIIITLIVFLVRVAFIFEDTQDSLEEAIAIFSFKGLNFYSSCAFLTYLCIAFPLIILLILANDLYKNHHFNRHTMFKIFLHHLTFIYYAFCVTYLINIIRDKNHALFGDEEVKFVNPWHKYVFSAFLITPLVVDAIYSIEIEKLHAKNEKDGISTKRYSKILFVFGSLFLGFYLLYAFIVLLKINMNFESLKLRNMRKDLKIAELRNHLQILIQDIVWNIFIAIGIGFMDVWTNPYNVVL